MNVILENLRETEIREACTRHHLPFTEDLRDAIKARFQNSWLRDTVVMSVLDESGLVRTIDACVAAIKYDPEYAKKFIPNTSDGPKPTMGPPRISLRDEAGQRDNFERIARGEIEVVDDHELPPR
jgi:hypothetical protein